MILWWEKKSSERHICTLAGLWLEGQAVPTSPWLAIGGPWHRPHSEGVYLPHTDDMGQKGHKKFELSDA